MATQRPQGYPVLIIGAGRGGSALLAMFLEDSLVKVVAIADMNPDAPGILLAKEHGVPTYSDAGEALDACKNHPDCIVYNLTHDDSIAEKANRVFGDKRVASGAEIKLFWQMVTNLKQIKNELEKSQHQLQSIIHNVMDGIIFTNEAGEIQGFNPAAEEIFGYSQREIAGHNVGMLMPEPARNGQNPFIDNYSRAGQPRKLGICGREVTAVRKNGEQFPMEISVSETVLGGQRYFIGIARDITERKLAEQKIFHMAHHDYLTDLPNRASFMNILRHSVALAKRNKQKVAVLFLDLDGFKQVNDSLGHEAGDLLLREVSKRLKKIIRDSDAVARVGGDEFTLELNNIGTDTNASLVTNKIITALSKPFECRQYRCMVGGSIGISIFPDDAVDAENLIKHADEAMYVAKRTGRNSYKFYRELQQ